MKIFFSALLLLASLTAQAQDNRSHRPRHPFKTDTLMVHDPVMAYEDGTYYLYATGVNIMMATSTDRQTWTVYPEGVLTDNVPAWTHDSVPEFRRHIWAPDIIRWHGRWWMMYSCSSFGVNTSAIGLISSPTLNPASPDYAWRDEGCVVASKGKRDDWNAIDPNIIIDDNDQPWMTWGSFWDGIQQRQHGGGRGRAHPPRRHHASYERLASAHHRPPPCTGQHKPRRAEPHIEIRRPERH